MRPYSSPLKSLAVLFELVQQRYGCRKGLPPRLVPPISLSSTSLSTEARLLALARLYARVSAFVAASCRFVGHNMVTTHNIAAYRTST